VTPLWPTALSWAALAVAFASAAWIVSDLNGRGVNVCLIRTGVKEAM